METPKPPPPEKGEPQEDDEEDSQSEYGRRATKKLQEMVRKKDALIAERVEQVEDLAATREEAARQAAAHVALQQRADEAQRDEQMRALAIWGLPRETHYIDQATSWESAVATALKDLVVEQRDLVGVDLSATPPRALFRTSVARTRWYDRHVMQSKGQSRQDKGSGKKRKSGGMALPEGQRVWLAFIETGQEGAPQSLHEPLEGAHRLGRPDALGASPCGGGQTLRQVAHPGALGRRRGPRDHQGGHDDVREGPDRSGARVAGAAPLERLRLEVRVQSCGFAQTLDEFMDMVRARRGEDYKGKGKINGDTSEGKGKDSKGANESAGGHGTGRGTAGALGYGWQRFAAPTAHGAVGAHEMRRQPTRSRRTRRRAPRNTSTARMTGSSRRPRTRPRRCQRRRSTPSGGGECRHLARMEVLARRRGQHEEEVDFPFMEHVSSVTAPRRRRRQRHRRGARRHRPRASAGSLALTARRARRE